MNADLQSFSENFFRLTGHRPMRWQQRLFNWFMAGTIPQSVDLPTGLGKTSVIAIWLIARALASEDTRKAIPRRLIYVVDRRAVVDQATEEAENLRTALEGAAAHLKVLLGLNEAPLPISTLRGARADNREWLEDPAIPAVIVGTVDMIGSRLLFEGYGVSRRMRPYHAGLLGADALVILDEAHLVPPFTSLLRSIETDSSLWPKDRAWLPRFVVLPLSATQRETPGEGNGRRSFGLEEEDWSDETAFQRLNARKQLRIQPLADKDQDRQLAEAALALAASDPPARVVVFCNRREKNDDGAGPSALGVADAIATLARGDKKAGREIDIEPPELLVGGRRVREREKVARRLKELGFTDRVGSPPQKPVFLVATSAGEVGIDFDADHMVCDLAPWERMVQRLGRVNRRGGQNREAQVIVFDTAETEKNEGRQARLVATRDLLERIETGFGRNAGPAALLELRRQVDEGEIQAASSPEPLRPALTRAVVDAWSMTSLEHHTGRPTVGPWLRGWVEEDLQTAVIWRTYLPVRRGTEWPRTPADKREIEAFFEAAPPHESERLETEAWRVVDWLQKRAVRLCKRDAVTIEEPMDVSAVEASEVNSAGGGLEISLPVASQATLLRGSDVAALVLSPDGSYARRFTLSELAEPRKGNAKEDLRRTLAGGFLVVDARLGGLENGMLDVEADYIPPTADIENGWSQDVGFRVQRATPEDYEIDADWHVERNFVLTRSPDGQPAEWLVVEHYRGAAQSEDGRSISWPQELSQHQDWVEREAKHIAERLGLSGPAVEALAVAAALHDEGKRAAHWQRAFNAPCETDGTGARKIFAKTRGPVDNNKLYGYRHEFGSLPLVEIHPRFQALSEEWRDLVLHLIAAHHGRARPVIETRGCEGEPPTALEVRACEVALRFARLQKRWGPWGLAWWEALLRAADQQASRDNETSTKTANSLTGRN